MSTANKHKISSRDLAAGFVKFHGTGGKPTQSLLPKDVVIEAVNAPELSRTNTPSYSRIKSTFRADLQLGDSRFVLSDLVADHLSVEQEELARFEKRVNEELEIRLAQIKDQSYKEGFEAGRQTGQEQAYSEEKAKIAASIEKMTIAIDSLVKSKTNLGQQYEVALVDMAFKLAKTVVNREVTERPELITTTIREILDRIGQNDDVRIRVSDACFEAIDQIREQTDRLSREGRITFDVDHALKAGDCIVESLSGEIASLIEQKFAKLQELMASSIAQSQSSGTGT